MLFVVVDEARSLEIQSPKTSTGNVQRKPPGGLLSEDTGAKQTPKIKLSPNLNLSREIAGQGGAGVFAHHRHVAVIGVVDGEQNARAGGAELCNLIGVKAEMHELDG